MINHKVNPIRDNPFSSMIQKESLWIESQRAEILFREYPDIKKAYYLSMRFGLIYHQWKHKNTTLTRLARILQCKNKEFRSLFRGVKDKAFFCSGWLKFMPNQRIPQVFTLSPCMLCLCQ